MQKDSPFVSVTAHGSIFPLAAALMVILLLGPVGAAFGHGPELNGESAQRRELNAPIADFVLTDQDGKRVAFKNLRGKRMVINFMYTSCPDVCPLLTASLKILRQQMRPGEAESIPFLSITTDPEIDTPAILKAYSKRNEADLPNWYWLTGDPRELATVWKNFGVSVDKQGRGLISHTTLTVVADSQGKMRFVYFGSFPDPDALLKDLRALEKENAINGRI
jgi:protein SCO1/2